MPYYNDSNKNRSLHITATKSDGDENTLNVTIRCDSMDLAGDIFQDITNYFKLNESESQIDFPDEFAEFANVTKRIIECNSARSKLTADMADETQRIKALVISAEDSRLIHDMQSMKRSYTELFSMNNQLISGYNLRSSNHENLLSALKEVNKMIQRVSNLRAGKAKTSMINECRQAVKQNNMTALMKIIKGR
jgi:Bardet-Biedl syndrome 2 protein